MTEWGGFNEGDNPRVPNVPSPSMDERIGSTDAIGYLASEGAGNFLVGYQIWWLISI